MYCPVFNLAGKPGQHGECVFIHCGTCLVPGTTVIIVLILPHAPRDVWALLLQRHHQGQSLVVKPFAGVVVSDVLHGVPHNLLIINMSLACDLPANHDHTSLCHSLAGNLCVRILLEMSVQDCVRHLVAHLVRMALSHRLGSEKELFSALGLHRSPSSYRTCW